MLQQQISKYQISEDKKSITLNVPICESVLEFIAAYNPLWIFELIENDLISTIELQRIIDKLPLLVTEASNSYSEYKLKYDQEITNVLIKCLSKLNTEELYVDILIEATLNSCVVYSEHKNAVLSDDLISEIKNISICDNKILSDLANSCLIRLKEIENSLKK
jgi:hypothetical protein